MNEGMGDGHQYVVTGLPSRPSKTIDDELTNALNRVAAHGYRLHSVLQAPQLSAAPFAIFEREVEWED